MVRLFFLILSLLSLFGCNSTGSLWGPAPPNHLEAFGKGANLETAKNEALKSLSQQLLVKVESQYIRISESKETEKEGTTKKLTQSVLKLFSDQAIPGVEIQTRQTTEAFYVRVLLNKERYLTWAKEKIGRELVEAKRHIDLAREGERSRNYYSLLEEAALAYQRGKGAYTTYLTMVGLGGQTAFDKELYKQALEKAGQLRQRLRVVIQVREKWAGARPAEMVLGGELTRLFESMGVPVERGNSPSAGAIPLYVRGWINTSFSSQVRSTYFYRTDDDIKVMLGKKVLYSSSGSGVQGKGGSSTAKRACREAIKDRAKTVLPEIQEQMKKLLAAY